MSQTTTLSMVFASPSWGGCCRAVWGLRRSPFCKIGEYKGDQLLLVPFSGARDVESAHSHPCWHLTRLVGKAKKLPTVYMEFTSVKINDCRRNMQSYGH